MNTAKQGFDPQMIANNLTPAYPTHPGEILKDEIEYRGISQRRLAAEMGITCPVLNEILNARRPITEKTALLFEAALGIPAYTLATAIGLTRIGVGVHYPSDVIAGAAIGICVGFATNGLFYFFIADTKLLSQPS